MKNFYLLILTFLALVFVGCDEVGTITPEMTYKEYIVVRSELNAWKNFEGVSFTKTLSIDEPYDTSKAILRNVTAYLKINDLRIIPLHYYQNGVYKPYGNVSIFPGDKFELFALVDDTPIYGMTKIPQIPIVVNSSYSNKHIDVQVKSNPSEAYGAVWSIVNPADDRIIATGDEFLSIVNSSYDISQQTTFVSTTDLPDQYTSETYKTLRCVKVFAFDEPYLKYFNTRNNNQPVSNAFVQGGDQVAWNVQGNNVIGLFIGVAESGYVKTN